MNLNTLINLLNSVRDQVGGKTDVLMFCDNNTSNPFDEDCDIVGYTLNEKKTKIIRMFYNKHKRPDGDRVTESVLISSIAPQIPAQKLYS